MLADHCAGPAVDEAARTSTRVVEARLVGGRLPTEYRYRATYIFESVETLKGRAQATFTETDMTVGCTWIGDHSLGDRYILVFGPADENGTTLGAWWKLAADGTIATGSFAPPSASLDSGSDIREFLRAHGALPDTSTDRPPLIPVGPAFLLLSGLALVAMGTARWRAAIADEVERRGSRDRSSIGT